MHFNIRVYGLFINKKGEILLTDEFQLNTKMTKFPGGGMELGEGTLDCLKREIKEEMNGQEITNLHHFYTTDFYQKGIFENSGQIVSIYYLADLVQPLQFEITDIPFNFKTLSNGNQSFRWVSLNNISKEDLSFPIDKIVLQKLLDTK